MSKGAEDRLEAIFEADFLDVSYGFRPGRNPHQALGVLRKCIMTGRLLLIENV
jgi:RNA-directed DNA polymerase